MSINDINSLTNIDKLESKKIINIWLHGQNIKTFPSQLINFVNVKNL